MQENLLRKTGSHYDFQVTRTVPRSDKNDEGKTAERMVLYEENTQSLTAWHSK